MAHVLHWMKGNSTTEAVATDEKVTTMSKDYWKVVYAKDDDLKLTKAGGNKIRRIMSHPMIYLPLLEKATSKISYLFLATVLSMTAGPS